jgi:hypothetical protein
MAKKITPKMLENADYYNSMRGNKGYVQDPGGDQDGRHKGYVYGYQCLDYPRVMFAQHVYLLDDAGLERVWSVDGEPCRDIREACQRLAHPPALTLWEYVCWTRLPPDPFRYSDATDAIAGCINPDIGIPFESPWSRASSGIDGLRHKGMIRFADGIGFRVSP